MNTHADKTQTNRNHSNENEVAQMQSGGDSIFQFLDNRREAITQRKVQKMASNSALAEHLSVFQQMANNKQSVQREGSIVEGGGEGLLQQQEFLNKLHIELHRVGTEEYKGTNLTVEGCPYIEYWFSRYQNAPYAHVEKALRKYVGESSASGDQLIALITERARLGFRKQVQTGEITELPSDVPEDVGRDKVPPKDFIVQRVTAEQGQSGKEMTATGVVESVVQRGILGNAPAAGPVFNFLPWGAAQTIGYKGKDAAYWNAVVAAGQPVWSGGVLGPGFYTTLTTNASLALVYSNAAGGHVMEVGYIGGLAGLNIVTIPGPAGYNPALHDGGLIDVLQINNSVLGQLCFKQGGPGAINLANFRFRPYP